MVLSRAGNDAGVGGPGRSAADDAWLSAHAGAVLEATGEGMFAVDPRGLCVFANAPARRMLGYEPEDLMGADLHALIHHTRTDGSPYPGEECPERRVVRTGEDLRVTDEVFWTKDGSPLPVEYAARPMVEGGEISGAVVTFRAVSARQQDEEKLRESNRRIETALENITDAFYTLDRDWRFTYLNSEAERLLGRKREDLLGKSLWKEFPAFGESAFYGPLHRASTERVTVEVEEYSSMMGAWFEARVYPSEEGLSVYFLNVDERKRADAAREGLLAAYERRAAELDAVISSIPDAVYIGDEGGIRACNDVALEMLGFENLAEMNQNIHVLADRLQNRFARTGGRIPPEEEPFARALRGETVVEEVVSRHLKAGRDVILRCAAAPIRHEGEVLGAVAVNTDISKRKRAEEELRESEVFARSTLNSLSAHIAILDETGLVLATNRAWQNFAESNPPITSGTGMGSNYLEVCDASTGEGSEEAATFARGTRDVISGRRESFEMEYPCHSPTERRWFVGRVTRFPDTHPPKVVVAHEDVTERKLVEEEIQHRVRQQEAVADLGRKALAEPDLSIVLDGAVECVARILEVEYAKVVELLPEGDVLLLRAGVGWKEGLVGNATEGIGLGSQAGYTLLVDKPVILGDLARENRFDHTPLLYDHGVVSGMSAIIRGHEKPFGVLAVHTARRRTFTEDDVNFLRAVSNVLGEAIERRKAEEALGEVREAERSRMARDLHDGPLQDLTYALTAAQLIQSAPRDPKLNHWLVGTVEALKRTGRELRAAVHDLRLEEKSNRPFSEVVESLVELNRRMEPDRAIHLDVAEGFPESPLGEKDSELLRIIQEALTNTRRHSGAKNVVVRLGLDGEEVWAQIEDDGHGFDPGAASGVGLNSMRERARALGANLEVHSEPGKGVRVYFAKDVKGEDPGEQDGPEAEIRVLLVEDHASFRDAAAAVFEWEAGFRVTGQAGSLAEAREIIRGDLDPVDVAIIDLGLPDGYGGDLIRELRESNPQAQALVLSASLDRVEIARAVEVGAAGILHKSAGMDEVLNAIRRLLAGEVLLPLEETVELLRLAASHRGQDLEARQTIAQLTPREREVLQALAEGLDGKEIARRLQISHKTERNHMANIMTKLGVHSRLQALVFALRHGVAEIR